MVPATMAIAVALGSDLLLVGGIGVVAEALLLIGLRGLWRELRETSKSEHNNR
jgi:hypothetical protein